MRIDQGNHEIEKSVLVDDPEVDARIDEKKDNLKNVIEDHHVKKALEVKVEEDEAEIEKIHREALQEERGIILKKRDTVKKRKLRMLTKILNHVDRMAREK